VVVNYHASEGEARDVVRRIEAMGQRAIAVQGDMSASADVAALADRLRSEFGRLDLLVNNASIFQPRKLLEVEEAEWDRVMAVNLKAPFLVLKATADLLAEAGGTVVNLVDLSAMQPWTDYAHHAVSKAGLLHLTRVMARAMAPRVRVNAIAPGSVLPPDDADPSYRARSKEKAALGTLGTPEDVVRTVLFLHRSPFITGEVVVVDGGRLLGG
jgi:pteridine reductase